MASAISACAPLASDALASGTRKGVEKSNLVERSKMREMRTPGVQGEVRNERAAGTDSGLPFALDDLGPGSQIGVWRASNSVFLTLPRCQRLCAPSRSHSVARREQTRHVF